MEKSTLDHIKLLTSLDTKTISERVMKLFEEGGELAKVVAPYENVSSTRHRFVEKKQVLEEVIDTLLVSYSIAYHMGFTDDEVEDMFKQKLLKWNNILTREEKTKGKPVPYEIHVTVKSEPHRIDAFRDVCKRIGVKPIVLALQTTKDEHVMQDVMTSSVHLGDNTSAYIAATDIKTRLTYLGFDVVRVKVETVPWHPAAPTIHGDTMPKDCYFESHVAVRTSADRKELLSELAEKYDAHMSRNIFKVIDDDSYVQMMTIRWYDGIYSDFDTTIDAFIKVLADSGFELEKKIVEFSVYDTRVAHDADWITSAVAHSA
jgi:hypothetical protein